MGDLFPGTELPVQDYGLFQEAIEAVMLNQNLQREPAMIAKVIQLYETMIVRWGVMLVGPTGGGKSSILNVHFHSISLNLLSIEFSPTDFRFSFDKNV